MGVARETEHVAADPATALAAWCDLSRWPTFVESFARVIRVDDSWPASGSEVVWQTGPHGRGQVTERVVAHELPTGQPARLLTDVREESLSGTQAVQFTADTAGSRAEIALEYRLAAAGGPLAPITDALFIRRALRHSLGRTLRRFAIELEAS